MEGGGGRDVILKLDESKHQDYLPTAGKDPIISGHDDADNRV